MIGKWNLNISKDKLCDDNPLKSYLSFLHSFKLFENIFQESINHEHTGAQLKLIVFTYMTKPVCSVHVHYQSPCDGLVKLTSAEPLKCLFMDSVYMYKSTATLTYFDKLQ